MNKSPLRELIEAVLNQPLDTYLPTTRKQGKSWQTISDDIYDATQLRITGETLRRWESATGEKVAS